MTLRRALATACLLLSAGTLPAQPASTPAGRWGVGDNVFLDLTSANGRAVTGVVWWRQGQNNERTPITAGSFDPASGALKLEGDVKRPDGAMGRFVIEGTIRGDTASGRYGVGAESGDFTFTRMDVPRPAPRDSAARRPKRAPR